MTDKYLWIIVIVIIVESFIFVHGLNNKQNIIKAIPTSIFKYEEKQLLTTISPYPVIESNNTYTSNNNFSSYQISYPDNWVTEVYSNQNFTKNTIRSNDPTNTSCIMIFQSKDNMPLLEVINFNKFMLDKNGHPFLLKEAVETTIVGEPAHISKLRLNSAIPNEFVHNVVIVQNNTTTTILRSCPETTDELFYSILKNFSFLE